MKYHTNKARLHAFKLKHEETIVDIRFCLEVFLWLSIIVSISYVVMFHLDKVIAGTA